MVKHKPKRTFVIISGILIGILQLWVLFIFFTDWTYDDPFITYRYAENIRNGLGFVYNPGHKYLSTTTPLFTLLLTGFGIFSDNLPLIARIIGIFSLVVGGLLIWCIGYSWDRPVVAWTGLLVYPTFPLMISPLGSETPFYLALSLGAFLAYINKKYWLTAVLAGMAVLTRADGILVPLIIGLDFGIKHFFKVSNKDDDKSNEITIPWTAIVVFIVLLGSWHGFAWYYFGSPFPETLAAKQLQGTMVISEIFSSGVWRVYSWYFRSWQNWVLTAMAIVGYFYVLISDRKWWIFLAWPILYFAAYSILGVTSYFWYYVPLIPGLIIASGLGASFIQRLSERVINQLKFSSLAISNILTYSIILSIGLAQVVDLPRVAESADQRYGIYRATGTWLNIFTPPDATIGALEVGIIGYFSQRNMIDFAGLIQPDVARVMGEDATYKDTTLYAINEYHPDYIVLYSGHYPQIEQYLEDQLCQVSQFFPKENFGSSFDLVIYSCPW